MASRKTEIPEKKHPRVVEAQYNYNDSLLKDGGNIIQVIKNFTTPSGVATLLAGYSLQERNDGYYQAFNEMGEKHFISIGKEIVETLILNQK